MGEHNVYDAGDVEMKILDLKLASSSSIIEVITTHDDDIIQILATDNRYDVFMVLTWDIVNDKEISMFQIKSELQNPEKYFMRGFCQS